MFFLTVLHLKAFCYICLYHRITLQCFPPPLLSLASNSSFFKAYSSISSPCRSCSISRPDVVPSLPCSSAAPHVHTRSPSSLPRRRQVTPEICKDVSRGSHGSTSVCPRRTSPAKFEIAPVKRQN